MAWKPHFEQGITLFKKGRNTEALEQFNLALTNGGENQFIIYDSRAAMYDLLNNPKEALRDAKTTIKLAPQRWQGYARAARLFMKTHKFDASLKTVAHALTHVRPEDNKRREELLKLKQDIVDAQEATAARERRMQNHMIKLPFEIYGEIFQPVLAEDHTQIITLLHVCSHWRQTVRNMPALWHTLVLSNSRADRKAALWLERSHCRIRELHVLQDYTSKQLPGRPTFLDDLKWPYLRVCRIHHPGIFKFINPGVMFRDVESLEINTQLSRIARTFFHPSTNLRSLSVLETELELSHLTHPTLSLTSLHLSHCYFVGGPLDNFIDVLSANPKLESLHLESLVRAPRDPIPMNLVGSEDLPDLKNLTVLEVIRNPWSSSILLLNIPSLQTLRFEALSHPALNDHFIHWISTNPKSLTELSLKNMAVDAVILIRLLRTIPTIEVLVLVGMYDTTNAVVTTLIETPAPPQGDSEELRLPCPCPRLRHLDVSSCPDVQTSTLHALVEQRVTLSALGVEEGGGDDSVAPPKVNKLEVLKMDNCPTIDAAWLPWFRERVREVSCVYVPSKKAQKGVAKRVNGL
ncbi:hypothetical protein P691DRAFT_725803 [Macrolepiota fuliginosa MF-IS2]|uniref:F-box domain-containing protein n=1 Tax=Macrolepiota fuliginosa MF-IS2 TaxID=1400762 RepID=A0A9P5XJA0_9AGAR|nr:hypothetical protein P691DRAFT_725803 [Macrolepiota fuliginosa MF-IS2]